jgi:ABC-2 family transporter
MTILAYTRRFLSDYIRNPVNVLLLVVVPAVFVGVVASTMADAAKLLGGPGGPAVETATAGWAAGFIAGIGMYFQTAATRDVDRRVVIAGLPPARLVAARLLSGLALALVASATAVTVLAIRSGVSHPGRVIAGTVMFAVIYLAVGAVVGSLAANPVNGTVIVLFVWIIDVFFGPAMGAADRPATRGLPTHFLTLWMVDVPSGHSGRPGDFGWALLWTLAAVVVALAVAVARTRLARLRRVRPVRVRRDTAGSQTIAGWSAAWRDARRNPALWVLFVLVPAVFILTADAVTPDEPIVLRLAEHGQRISTTYAMPDVHGATMAPIAIASLATLVGLFTMLDARAGDRRAALAGMRTGALLVARFAVLTVASLAATAVALGTTALVFHATSWSTYAAANIMLALTYALIGALLAPAFGRVGGVFIAFLLPFLDIGIVQSPMLHPDPTSLSRLLPGYGGSRVLVDGALTATFDETGPLLLGLAWLLALVAAVALIYRHSVKPAYR